MPRLLHGTLFVAIFEVDNLQNGRGFNFFTKGAGQQNCGKKFLSKVKRTVLCRTKIVGSRLYATVDLDKARSGRTRMIENQPYNPQWYECFNIYCAHLISNVIFTVKDDQVVAATLIGRAYIPVEDVIKGYIIDRWVDILDEDHNPIGSKIHVKLHFVSCTHDSNWSKGIQTPRFDGVPYTFFNQRQGCRVTLYQDAHVPNNFNVKIPIEGKTYEAHRCWEDIFDAITNAKHLIYIAGWSVYTEITLVRDPQRPKPGGDIKIGELLKKKADEGVTVLVLIWDDRTGLMATHDKETEKYFRNTKVHCFLCPRNPDKGRSKIQGFEISKMFTHHQKTVVVDCEMPDSTSQKRRIVSFVGGIDLCDGRYDTQDHPLFKTLDTIHHDDFHQPNFPGSSIKKGGPREPWHDIHCKLEGPVAWDVLSNFEQRWKKQVGERFLIPQQQLEVYTIRPLLVLQSSDPNAWNVQLFRSIDGGAVVGFPEKPEDVAAAGLVSGKDNIIDRSIQDAYINAIRRAKNFIYIENQYFLGSSFGWKSKDIKVEDNNALHLIPKKNQYFLGSSFGRKSKHIKVEDVKVEDIKVEYIKVEDINALHLIPKELSLKIASKIDAGERFTVYIVIPMWPEGKPESGSVQAILDLQRRTMEMMYSDIAEALKRNGLKHHPREYLSFFCLGNRETMKLGEYSHPEAPDPDSDYSRAQQARRFMIYVHAKMMIVDDEYIIIGSANINQRSMDGARDSEIAMGGYQPHHLATTQPARGQIYSFRLALWYEHLGFIDPSFLHPESVECIQLVNKTADELWEIYASEAFDQDLIGHLLRYPIEVTRDGAVTTMPGTKHFPDTKAPILGNKSEYLPPILTT